MVGIDGDDGDGDDGAGWAALYVPIGGFWRLPSPSIFWEGNVHSLHRMCSFLKLLPVAVCRGSCIVSSEWTRPNLAVDVHSWDRAVLPLSVRQREENMNIQEHRCKGGGSRASSPESSWEQHYLCPPRANSWWSHLSFLSFFSLSAILHPMF